ncbi:MAG TPA: TrbC/VirB2 family protein [Spirochaetia bacterium]|nr:TrbC/VirB2 family protein [Spirochaetia bacterium]
MNHSSICGRRVALVGFLLFFSPAVSLLMAATVTGGSMPWDGPLQQIEADLQGPTAIVIGTILIVAGGFGIAATHGQGAGKLLWVVVGVGIALNAAKLLSVIAGSGSGFDIPLSVTPIHHAMLSHSATVTTLKGSAWIH